MLICIGTAIWAFNPKKYGEKSWNVFLKSKNKNKDFLDDDLSFNINKTEFY